MGGKRSIQRYKNIFCIVCCLILILLCTGCQYNYYPQLSFETMEGQKGRIHLQKASDHVAKGNFQAALDENQKAYDLFPPQLKQEAIFQKALIYAHADNPDRNHEKAMVCFELIDKDPNNTVLANNSALVLSILKENQDLLRDNRGLSKKTKASQKKTQTLVKEQKKLKNYIAKLRQQIRQLKEIDLSSRIGNQGGLNE